MSRIICGFAGIGKSTAAKEMPSVVDLESTPFNKNWAVYVDVAEHMYKNGYTVLLSCHRELREELHARGLEYLLALPPTDKKDEYIKRYIGRNNTDEFVKLLSDNWDSFLEVMPWETVLTVDGFLAKPLDSLTKEE